LSSTTTSADEAIERQTENLLGALSLAITDRVGDAVTAAADQAGAGAIALSALHHFLDGPSVDQLRQVLGLTSSGTVRLVDRLVAAGLARREVGRDGRVTRVRLTASGRRTARQVTTARARVLRDAVAVLSPEQRVALNGLLGQVAAGLVRAPGAQRWTCRQCDTGACGREAGRCPVAAASGFSPG
jgi:MarR family transcriptional repressor of emrRAB